MLETLLAFSLVKRLAESHLLSIHRLVQAVQLDRIDPEEQQQWAERVVTAVNAIFPRDPKNEIAMWPLCLRYLEQAQACASLIQQLKLTLTEGADLLNRTGTYLQEHTSYTLAEPLFQQALHIYEQHVAPKYSQVIHSLNNLADLYREQGKYAEAEPLFQRAIHIWEQSVGPEHPQMAYPLNNLADLYREQGKYAEAEPLFQQALSIREHALEPYHPAIADILCSLAVLREEQSKSKDAASLYCHALTIREKAYGPEHPKTADTRERLHTVLDRMKGITTPSTVTFHKQ